MLFGVPEWRLSHIPLPSDRRAQRNSGTRVLVARHSDRIAVRNGSGFAAGYAAGAVRRGRTFAAIARWPAKTIGNMPTGTGLGYGQIRAHYPIERDAH